MTDPAALSHARERLSRLLADFPQATRRMLIDHWQKAATADERRAAMVYGVDRLLGEVERKRSGPARLRRAERTTGVEGEQLQIPLLDMTFAQAEATIAHKDEHARGVLAEAGFEARIVAIAKERCRERGLDPYALEFHVGDFIDEAEVADLRNVA